MTDFEIVVIQSEITRNRIREREIEEQRRRRNEITLQELAEDHDDAPLVNLLAPPSPAIDLIPQPITPIPPTPTPPPLRITLNTILEEQEENMAETIPKEEISIEDISIQGMIVV